MWPLTLTCKPRYKHLLDLEYTFFLLVCRVEAKQRDPNNLSILISGKHWWKPWNGHLLCKKDVGNLLIIWMACQTA